MLDFLLDGLKQVDFPLKLPAIAQCPGWDILVSGLVLESYQEKKISKKNFN